MAAVVDSFILRGKESFPALSNLFGGWFHQDWNIEGPDLETIVPKYAKASSQYKLSATIAEIQLFINMYGKDDRTLQDAVERVFDPDIIVEGWEGFTTREWLLRVKQLLEAES